MKFHKRVDIKGRALVYVREAPVRAYFVATILLKKDVSVGDAIESASKGHRPSWFDLEYLGVDSLIRQDEHEMLEVVESEIQDKFVLEDYHTVDETPDFWY